MHFSATSKASSCRIITIALTELVGVQVQLSTTYLFEILTLNNFNFDLFHLIFYVEFLQYVLTAW